MATKIGLWERTAPRRVLVGEKLRGELRPDGWWAVNVAREHAVPCGAAQYLVGEAEMTAEAIDDSLRGMLELEIANIRYVMGD